MRLLTGPLIMFKSSIKKYFHLKEKQTYRIARHENQRCHLPLNAKYLQDTAKFKVGYVLFLYIFLSKPTLAIRTALFPIFRNEKLL